MESGSFTSGDSRASLDVGSVEQYDSVLEPWVMVRSLVPGYLFVAEDKSRTGNSYVWPTSGSEVKVHPTDAKWLLSKIRRGCCGGSDSPYFELVE